MAIAITLESYNKLLEAERGLTGLVGELDKAEQCGIECQNYRDALRTQLNIIANIKHNFAPKTESQ